MKLLEFLLDFLTQLLPFILRKPPSAEVGLRRELRLLAHRRKSLHQIVLGLHDFEQLAGRPGKSEKTGHRNDRAKVPPGCGELYTPVTEAGVSVCTVYMASRMLGIRPILVNIRPQMQISRT